MILSQPCACVAGTWQVGSMSSGDAGAGCTAASGSEDRTAVWLPRRTFVGEGCLGRPAHVRQPQRQIKRQDRGSVDQETFVFIAALHQPTELLCFKAEIQSSA